MPVEKKLTALEEAEFEDKGGEEGSLEKEIFSLKVCLVLYAARSPAYLTILSPISHANTECVSRRRVIIHGPRGICQGYIGAATLHHPEDYHVQSLEPAH
jgi:hypothetical protein